MATETLDKQQADSELKKAIHILRKFDFINFSMYAYNIHKMTNIPIWFNYVSH